MLDRASTFADPEIIALLQKHFVPVAIDQFAQRRQKDAEGDFWRKIAGQSPRHDFSQTTQGLFLATPDGTLLGYNNNRGPERIKRLMQEALETFKKTPPKASIPLTVPKPDQRFLHSPPDGVRVVRVHAKVLGGYAPTDDPWKRIFQESVSRDHLWITRGEEQVLVKDRAIAPSLAKRIALYHLIDNTRGEPTFWEPGEIKSSSLILEPDGTVGGSVRLQRADDSSGFEAFLRGAVETKNGRLTRFDLVALGTYHGHGRYTGGGPEGPFPLAVSFRLIDASAPIDQVPPQGAKSWWQHYLGRE